MLEWEFAREDVILEEGEWEWAPATEGGVGGGEDCGGGGGGGEGWRG